MSFASRSLIDSASALSNPPSAAMLADLLEPNILGTLYHFDRYLNEGTNSVSEKAKAYNSLVSYIKLMGSKYVTRVRMRVMTTLKIGLRYRESAVFVQLCCDAWNTFLRLVEMAALAPMLSQIVVSLLPLLHIRPAEVSGFMCIVHCICPVGL